MAIRGRRSGRRFGAVTVAFALTALAAGSVSADTITLRGGGQVRGKVVPLPGKADKVQVILERGKTPLTLQKEQVLKVEPEPGPLDGYVVRRAAAAATAEAQFDLGTYCEQNRLPDLARLHFETAVKLDKGFALAHEKLGHANVGGRWLSDDELRTAQGLVRVKGKWLTPEEKEQLDKAGATAAEQASWVRRIRVWRDAIEQGPDDHRREAEAQLLSLRDPSAVTPLVRVLGPDDAAMRGLLAKSLGAIPGAEAASALVHRLLGEADGGVRGTVLDELKRRPEPEVVKALVQGLRSKELEVINRAAWGLSGVKAVKSVPDLIPALVLNRTRVVMAMGDPGQPESGAITAAFGGYAPVGLPNAAPIAYNGSSIGYLTAPTVGPGVVAYGATSLPAYGLAGSTPNYSNFGVGGGVLGGGGQSGFRGPTPKMVAESIQNTEVHAALTKLTGEDFGYDVNAWKRWLRNSFQPEPAPTRRVPQP